MKFTVSGPFGSVLSFYTWVRGIVARTRGLYAGLPAGEKLRLMEIVDSVVVDTCGHHSSQYAEEPSLSVPVDNQENLEGVPAEVLDDHSEGSDAEAENMSHQEIELLSNLAPCGDAEPAVNTQVEHFGLLFNIGDLTSRVLDTMVLNVLAYRAAAVLAVFLPSINKCA